MSDKLQFVAEIGEILDESGDKLKFVGREHDLKISFTRSRSSVG
jgi:hypothetical protein